mmetsp:Transcript_102012/g.233647  ORF Transcript_102012/g.233647 Transcript_102012/m.233647 type:complete len:236 (+) Transcript_102012:205-912(+)|eukprot:CAMPEP_0204303108 /NCGR_PEP_ID=MMETSP0468-20130131/83274_1 /ASSEMBLY_ACC=CAM_ASM_000383 /TAXON_ID=2969 /ORGANISM="Oxyrrhis marina" /LENGTH=235 /DNA_ID=CAMNT_0051282393 /DNA_START=129 /DNA_END=836 /DNA_ORIENTATION=+
MRSSLRSSAAVSLASLHSTRSGRAAARSRSVGSLHSPIYMKTSPSTYNPHKTGWYHPAAQAQNEMLCNDGGARSWAADIRKSKDHVGYGDGTIGYGDVQESAISRGAPHWFSGVRMVPGPYGVPRFPAIGIEEGKLQTHYPKFTKGPNLSIIQDAPDEPEQEECHFDDWKGNYAKNRGANNRCAHGQWICDRHPCVTNTDKDTASQMIGGGCVVKRPYVPPSHYVSVDPAVSFDH